MNTLRVDIALYNKQMKLPGAKNAVVTPDKTTKYLLSATHASGRHKARFFAAFGFSADLAEQLASALIRHANEHEVTKIETSPFGTRYVIDGQIMSPDCVFHAKLDTDSAANWTPGPRQTGQAFQGKLDTLKKS